MTLQELRPLLSSLLSDAAAITNIAKPAEKHRKPLGGHNDYADRFHSAVVRVTAGEKKVRPHLNVLDLDAADLSKFDQSLGTLKDAKSKAKEKVEGLRTLTMVCDTAIIPKAEGITASPVPTSETVLPLAVVKGTRGYLEKVVTQANGCYERQWYDACSVMIRKLGEILIIAVYEHKGAAAEIKDGDGHYFMLSKLIAQIRTKLTDWHLGRGTGPCLEKMKELGDSSAHHRHYVATKQDIDGLLSKGFRTTVEELLNHSGLRK